MKAVINLVNREVKFSKLSMTELNWLRHNILHRIKKAEKKL